MDVRVPDGGHRSALDDEEDDLGEMAGGDEGDDHLEEDCEIGSRSVHDPKNAEGDGDFGEPYADYVEHLRDSTPFHRARELFRM